MAIHPNPLSVKYLTGVVSSRPDRAAWRSQYIGDTLLPMRDVGGYQLAWDVVQSENGLAGMYALNGRPIPGSDIMFEQRYSEVHNIMASKILHPTDVMQLREAGQLAVSKTGKALAEASQRKLRDAIAWCDDTVDATKEYLQLRALQGSIAWPPNDADGNPISELAPEWGNLQITITYPLRTVFQQNVSTLVGFNSRTGGAVAWNTIATANPLLDLEVIAQYIEELTGLDAHNSRIIMGGEVMSYLAFNANIISWFQGTEKGTKMVDAQALKQVIETKIGYSIEIYNAKWTYRTSVDAAGGPTIHAVPFLGRGKVLIVPKNSNPGYTAVAPSPDGKYKPGKYQWLVREERPPWETEIGEGLVCLPIPEHFTEIFVLDVFN